MRDSFIFYASFAQAANMLGDKARLKLYDSVVKLGLSCAENETELNQVCTEIETSLVQNRNAFAQFLLIKPQIIANFSRYLNGLKGKEFGALGAEFGKLGGRPKKNTKNPPNVNVNVNEKDNIKENNIKDKNQRYGECKNVLLSDEQFNKLSSEHPDLSLAIEKLDTWLGTSGSKNRNKNHYAYFKSNSWVWEGLKETKPDEDECWF